MKKQYLFFLINFYFCTILLSQDTDPNSAVEENIDSTKTGFSFSLNTDGYLMYNASQTASRTSMILEHNTPALGFVSGELDYTGKKIGGKINLAIGPRASQFYGLDDNEILKYIKQAYVYYEPIEALKLSIGTSAAFIGYEYDEAYLNPNYSASYLNSASPATFTGVWLDYKFHNNWTWTNGIYNDTDRKIDKTPGIHIGSVIAFEKNKTNALLSFYQGQEGDRKLMVFDFLADFKVSDKNGIGLEIQHTSYKGVDNHIEHYKGINIYLKHQFSDITSVCLRNEYFDDPNGVYFEKTNNTIYGFTLTATHIMNKFRFMPELRFDNSSAAIFNDTDRLNYKENFNAILGLVYLFD